MTKLTFKIKSFYLLFAYFVILTSSCSSLRKVERLQQDEIYNKLQLERSRRDNYDLFKEVATWLYVPHRLGGTSHSGVDCSFFVMTVYQRVYAMKLERNSANIMKINCKRRSKHRLHEGDLVFFNTSNSSRKTKKNINHVGIYLKDDKFIHASTSRGVIVSDLNENYYKKTWVCGGHVK